MKHKWKWAIVTIVILFVAVAGFFAIGAYSFIHLFEPTLIEIKKGFSPELTGALKEEYEITVPENATFIKGYNYYLPQDPSEVIVWFECPIDELPEGEGGDLVCRLLELEEDSYSSQAWRAEKHSNELYNEMGEFDYQINYKKKSDTYISYKFDQGKIIIRFVGWKPPCSFPDCSQSAESAFAFSAEILSQNNKISNMNERAEIIRIELFQRSTANNEIYLSFLQR